MNTALVVLLLVAAVAAEAPYHLPRPGVQAPAFHLPVPAPPPPQARPPPPPPQFGQPQPNFGYQYQQPSIGPTFVQNAPQQNYPVHHQPAPAYFAPAPVPQPFPVSHPHPHPHPHPAPISQPSQSYGLPHSAPHALPSAPIHHHQAFGGHQIAPQPLPQPQLQPLPQLHFPQPIPQLPQPIPHFHQPIGQPHLTVQHGYNYQQPEHQLSQQIPLQAQPLSNHISTSALSSYQADSHQYSGAHAQTHRDALDSVVVGRLQNIIKEDEHIAAKNAGFLSLVSGVSLENAKPSVEISSFVQTSPIHTNIHQSTHGSSSHFGHSAPSANYGVPSVVSSSQSSSSGSFNSESFNFLPQNKLAQSYGPPN